MTETSAFSTDPVSDRFMSSTEFFISFQISFLPPCWLNNCDSHIYTTRTHVRWENKETEPVYWWNHASVIIIYNQLIPMMTFTVVCKLLDKNLTKAFKFRMNSLERLVNRFDDLLKKKNHHINNTSLQLAKELPYTRAKLFSERLIFVKELYYFWLSLTWNTFSKTSNAYTLKKFIAISRFSMTVWI